MDDSSIPPSASEHLNGTSSHSAEELDWRVVDAYLAGKATPDQRAHVKTWIGESEVTQRVLDALRDPETHDVVHADVEGRWKEFLSRLPAELERSRQDASHQSQDKRTASATPVTKKSQPRVTQPWRQWIWGAGAAVVITLGMFVLRPTEQEKLSASHTYATGPNQQGAVTLNDGTDITLSPNTTVQVLTVGYDSRAVVLERGEAYFNVARAPGAPFTVRSGTARIGVLGTSFLIRNAGDGVHTHVAVSEGRVQISDQWHPDSLMTLNVGQTAEIADSTRHVNERETLAPGAEWLRDRILFHDTPVSVVLATLGRWYGYQFRCTDSVLSKATVTIMVSTKSSTTALATLEQILAVNLSVVGDTVTLTPQPARRAKGTIPRMQTYDVWTPAREVGR